jgi:hypothetical protein
MATLAAEARSGRRVSGTAFPSATIRTGAAAALSVGELKRGLPKAAKV